MKFWAICSALASALCFAATFVSQQHVAERVPERQGRGLRLFLHLIRNPLWVAGLFGDIGGFACQAIALACGSIALVQPFLVTSLIFALPLAARWNKRRISRGELAWASAVVAALAVFTVLGDPQQPATGGPTASWLWPGTTICVLTILSFVISLRLSGSAKATGLGITTGLAYGTIAVLTDAVMEAWTQHGILAIVTTWQLYALIVFSIAGTAIQQLAFHAGSLAASLPATQVLEPLTGVLLGMIIFQARLTTTGFAWIFLAASVAVMGLGTVMLSRSAARTNATQAPPDHTLAPDPMPSR